VAFLIDVLMLQFLANGLCKGAIIAVVALGFGLIYTTTRVFHIAHAGVYVLAAYALWAATALWQLPLLAAIPLALAGMLAEWAVYQPLAQRSAPAAVVMISSVGLQTVLENLVALGFGNQTQILRAGVEQTVQLGSVILTVVQILQLLTGLAVAGGFWLFLRQSHAGQICRAIADDTTLALVLGFSVPKLRLLVFVLGSVLAGIGAVLAALDVGVDPHAGFAVVLASAVACIIGGLGHFLAPVVGGFLLGIAQSMVAWQTSAQWEEAATFGLLMMFLLFRRQGLFGVRRRAEEA
jgi:branched-chain amino acid transport system permease protein